MEQFVTIEIFGQPFTFRSEAEGDRAQEVADFLVREVSRVETQQTGAMTDKNKLVILISAALNIANENMQLRSSYSDLRNQVIRRTVSLNRILEERATPGGGG